MSESCCCSTLYIAGAILLLYLLSYVSNVVNYCCKMVLYSFVYLLVAVLHLLYCPFFPKNRDNTYTLSPVFYHLSRFVDQ